MLKDTVIKLKDRAAAAIGAKCFAVTLTATAAAAIFLHILFTALPFIELNGGAVTSVTGFSLIKALFSGLSEVNIYGGGAARVLAGICYLLMFVSDAVLFALLVTGLMGSGKKLISRYVFMYCVQTAIAVVLLVLFYGLLGGASGIYGETAVCSAVWGIFFAAVIPAAIAAALNFIYGEKHSAAALFASDRLKPLLCAALAVVLSGTAMFGTALLFVDDATQTFSSYLSAVRGEDRAAYAAAFYERGSVEYFSLADGEFTEAELSCPDRVEYSVAERSDNYVRLKVSAYFDEDDGGKITTDAHLGRLSTGWYFMTPYNLKTGNVYDGGFLLFDNLRYRKGTDGALTVCGVMGIDSGKLESIIIPATYRGVAVKSIAMNAFNGLTELKRLTVRDGVETVGEYAFRDCKNLEYADLPNGIEIGGGAFQGTKTGL